MFKFVKHQKYRRQEVWKTVKGSNEKMSRNFHQSGYERINEDRLLHLRNFGLVWFVGVV